jgi:hypothetical protein
MTQQVQRNADKPFITTHADSASSSRAVVSLLLGGYQPEGAGIKARTQLPHLQQSDVA